MDRYHVDTVVRDGWLHELVRNFRLDVERLHAHRLVVKVRLEHDVAEYLLQELGLRSQRLHYAEPVRLLEIFSSSLRRVEPLRGDIAPEYVFLPTSIIFNNIFYPAPVWTDERLLVAAKIVSEKNNTSLLVVPDRIARRPIAGSNIFLPPVFERNFRKINRVVENAFTHVNNLYI